MENYSGFIHPKFDGIVLLLDLMSIGADAIADAVRRRQSKNRGTGRGLTLRAGSSTPLWNALATLIRADCKKYGDKARLARYLSLPRQRMHEFLHATGPVPDGERTLMLLQWLVSQRSTQPEPSRKTSPENTGAPAIHLKPKIRRAGRDRLNKVSRNT